MISSSDELEVYRKIERKQELVDSLKELLNVQLEASETLDNKAWEILKVTSATVGLVSALEITISEGTVGKYFWAGLGVVLVLYFLQVVAVMLVVRPREWRLVPGGEDGVTRYDTLLKKYVYPDDSVYLNQLIADYVGMKNPNEGKEPLLGAIQVAQRHNKQKGWWLVVEAVLLGLIVAGLVIMAIAAVS
jgi:hypothetical protein